MSDPQERSREERIASKVCCWPDVGLVRLRFLSGPVRSSESCPHCVRGKQCDQDPSGLVDADLCQPSCPRNGVAHVRAGVDQPGGVGPSSKMISRWQDHTKRMASRVPIPAPRGSPAGPNLKLNELKYLLNESRPNVSTHADMSSCIVSTFSLRCRSRYEQIVKAYEGAGKNET